jgi:rhodanese-related sulfurtransferase
MVHTVTSNELAKLVSDRGPERTWDLIDVRDPEEWETGHLEGARLVPLETLRADPDAALAGSRDATIVFICARGVRSLAAAKLAERFGYEHVYNLEGGTKEWVRTGLTLVTDQQRVAA